MSLSNAGAIANQSIGAIAAQINVVSRNIAGSSAAGFAAKTALVSTSSNGGVQIDGVARATSAALFQSSLQANSAQAAASALVDGLDQIDLSFAISTSTSTDTSGNRTPAALIAALSSALQTYSVAPSDLTAAQSVLSAAQSLVQSLNDSSDAVQDLRKQADAAMMASVDDINDLLAQFEKVNNDVVYGTQSNRDVTASIDQRDALLTKLSTEIGITTVTRANNDVVIYADGGATLFEATARAVTFQQTSGYSASTIGASVYVDGVPVAGPTASMAIQSGKLQGLAQLRDVVMPQYQSQLDEIARGLVIAFAETDQNGSGATAQGLFVSSDPETMPSTEITPGLAGAIAINVNVDPSQGGDLDRLRDGGISDPGDSAYVYNTTGATGFADRINEMISALASTQEFDTNAGIGSDQSVADYASSSIGWFEAQRKAASESADYQSTLQSQTSQALSNATGVNLDDQLSKMLDLENSYQASAKLLAAVDAMYKALFQAL
jgi:flagellar hook-associated protein 1 FlgK